MGQAIRGAVLLVAVAACLVALRGQGLAQDGNQLNVPIPDAADVISRLDETAAAARRAAKEGDCRSFEEDISYVAYYGNPALWTKKYQALSADDKEHIRRHSVNLWRELNSLDCPPKKAQGTAPIHVEITTAEIWIDQINSYVREVREAAAKGDCDSIMGPYAELSALASAGVPKSAHLAPDDRVRVQKYAKKMAHETGWLVDKCEVKAGLRGGWAVSAGGGGSVVAVPQVKDGTKIIEGVERPVAKSDGTLTGGSANFLLEGPVGPNLRAFFGYSGSWANGSSHGSTDGDAALTYPFPNPDGGSTGIGPESGGESVHINSDAQINDVSAGVMEIISELQKALRVSDLLLWEGNVNLSAGLGVRYRNLSIDHTMSSELLGFNDVFARTNLNQDSNFYGGQIATSLNYNARGTGFFGDLNAYVALGALDTSVNARQGNHCGACGEASPEFNVLFDTNFDQTNFSAIFGGGADVGYRFNGGIDLKFFVNVDEMTNVPFVRVPITPPQQPWKLDEDNLTNVTVGGRVVVPIGDIPPEIRLLHTAG
jgi:hypothetical protein